MDGTNSPFPSMTHQDKNGLYPPTVGKTDTTMNSYIPLLGPSPDHYPTSSQSDETIQTSADKAHQQPIVALRSLQDAFPGRQTRANVPNGHFVQLDAMVDRTLRDLSPRFDTDSPQSFDQMTTELRATTDIVANSDGHERSMTEETQVPMHAVWCQVVSTRGPSFFTNILHVLDRRCHEALYNVSKTNQAAWTHNEGEHLPEGYAIE
ncbi:hypothetical protein EDB89DRAFT_1907457 [Lactarius sanguifluus]|nr:hypothetical protein EDB89DRAFT_1907457 [Lactarius sanguifluus]